MENSNSNILEVPMSWTSYRSNLNLNWKSYLRFGRSQMNNRHCLSSQIRRIVPQLCNQEEPWHSRYNEDLMDNSEDNLKEDKNYYIVYLHTYLQEPTFRSLKIPSFSGDVSFFHFWVAFRIWWISIKVRLHSLVES